MRELFAEKMSKVKAIEILKDKLVGQFISKFSVGDTWDFNIGEHWLSAHEIFSEDEVPLNVWLRSNYDLFNSTVDKENISKSTIVAALLRREITNVKLDDSCKLTIGFEGGVELVFLTNVDIVDWQWCLNSNCADPYIEYTVACFWEGKIAVNENQD